ncbi:nuclear transport factor 2 family protein [Streptomyces sp. NPDC046909]|uniref:nuclear transport factor 2 family protein n=1 Tax=Streptomyces sp. NPDC046909 TaxID=3155617 RepID=UPI00340BFB0C
MNDVKATALKAWGELIGDKDPSAVDRWVSPDYIQHSPTAGPGREPLRQLIAGIPDGFHHETHRVLADGDLVALHGTYHGAGPTPLVAFDVFRYDTDGQAAEHWDALAPQAATTVSGRTQTDGPTEITDLDRTEANRALVTAFVETVLVGDDPTTVADYVSADTFHQHSPEIADGLDGLTAAVAQWKSEGRTARYLKLHLVVAEGNFVLTQSEVDFGGPAACYDLFRVADGKIVEHWDVVMPVPDRLPHDNGLF